MVKMLNINAHLNMLIKGSQTSSAVSIPVPP